jgi:DNA-binding ferritin-like protein
MTLQNDLLNLLACLKAIHWYAWNAHWQSKGKNSYADHLLFERIYAGEPSIIDQIDGLGERVVGLGYSVDPQSIDQRSRVYFKAAARRVGTRAYVSGALALEITFQHLAQKIIKASSSTDTQSIILDNYIRTLVDDRSTVVYLLKQRQGR